MVVEGRDAVPLDRLLARVRDGLYVGRIWYTYPINGLRAGDFTCTVVGDSFIIRDGRITAPLKANTLRINDNLTRLHNLSRMVDGRMQEALVTGDEAVVRQWLMSLKGLQLCKTSKLDPNREYYVRISARVRPPGTSLLGWANSVTSQAKFTFIP